MIPCISPYYPLFFFWGGGGVGLTFFSFCSPFNKAKNPVLHSPSSIFHYGQEPARGPQARPIGHLAWHVLGCLSKQIKGIRALKDDGGCFYVLPQAAVAPIGLEEWVMGLKHSACSQMQGTLYRTSKCSVIYILVIHYGIFNGKKSSTNNLLWELFRRYGRL